MASPPGANSGPADHPTLRAIAPSAFLPALVFAIGEGATAPIIALTALDLGAAPSTAAYMLALLGVGQVLGDVPSSSLADRIGDRRAMVLAAAVAVPALLACLLTSSLLLLAAALVVLGMCNAAFYLARQSYLTEVVPLELRARAMSTLGGAHRIGLFIGPFVGAGAIALTNLRAAYVVAMITAVITGVLLLVIPDVPGAAGAAGAAPPVRGQVSVYAMLLAHRRLFATLGLAVLAIGAVRAARQTVLPLWAAHIGLNPETTSLVFGFAGAVDAALFYPAGKVMDRWGRLTVAVPAMLILGATMMALPLSQGVVSIAAFAMLMSFGNGIGAGIMMTLGADTAPADSRIRFLSIWRVMSDTGNAAGPIIVSVVAAAWTLAAGIVAVGSMGLLAGAGLAAWAPRYSPFATRAMMRAHRAR